MACVAISPDNRLIASSKDYDVRLGDASTGEAVGGRLMDHSSAVRAVSFLPNSRWLASTSKDNTVRIWDVDRRQESDIGPFQCDGYAYSVAFSPDGRLIAAGDESCKIHIGLENDQNLEMLCPFFAKFKT